MNLIKKRAIIFSVRTRKGVVVMTRLRMTQMSSRGAIPSLAYSPRSASNTLPSFVFGFLKVNSDKSGSRQTSARRVANSRLVRIIAHRWGHAPPPRPRPASPSVTPEVFASFTRKLAGRVYRTSFCTLKSFAGITGGGIFFLEKRCIF